MQYRPSSSYNSPFFTTNSGAPVWNNNSSLTVGSRGKSLSCFVDFFHVWVHYRVLYGLSFSEVFLHLLVDLGFVVSNSAYLRCIETKLVCEYYANLRVWSRTSLLKVRFCLRTIIWWRNLLILTGKESQNVLFMLEVRVLKGFLKWPMIYLISLVLISLEPLESRPLLLSGFLLLSMNAAVLKL